MSKHLIRRVATTAAVASALLIAGLAASAVAQAQSSGALADAQARLAHPQLQWDTTTCSGAPIAYVDDVLLGVDLTEDEILTVEFVLGDNLAYLGRTEAAFTTTVFHLTPGSAAEMKQELATKHPLIEVEFDHVFFYDPHWRFSPQERPTSTTREIDDTVAFDHFGEALRPIVVLDTGYPRELADPEKYSLGHETRTDVDATALTAYHGPFIASQIAELVPGADIRLQRVLTERGALAPQFAPGQETFDELALIETLNVTDLGEMANAVVNMSFGTYGCEGSQPRALEAVLEKLPFIDVAAAAGNDETDALQYPASFGGSIDHRVHSVGAHDGYLFGPSRACFSNYGDVEVWAPGAGVLGRIPDGGAGTIAEASGTSFAAPYVAAALAANVDVYSDRFPFVSQVSTPNTAPSPAPAQGPSISTGNDSLDFNVVEGPAEPAPYPGAQTCP